MSRHRYSLADHPEARQRALWLIRDYDHLREMAEDIDGFSGGGTDGGPRSTVPHDGVSDAAIRRARITQQLDAIEKGLLMIPEEYRSGIWENIQHRERFPQTAGIKTWKRWKQRFIWWVAYYAELI